MTTSACGSSSRRPTKTWMSFSSGSRTTAGCFASIRSRSILLKDGGRLNVQLDLLSLAEKEKNASTETPPKDGKTEAKR